MEFRKSLMVLALFLGTNVEAVKLGRHGNFSAGKEPSAELAPEQSTFLQTGFIEQLDDIESVPNTINLAVTAMENSRGQDSNLVQMSV